MKTILVIMILSPILCLVVQAQTLPATSQGKQITVFLEPEVDTAQLRPHQALMREKPGTQEAAQAQLEIAHVYYRARAYSGAIPQFEQAISLHQSSSITESALYHLARSYAQVSRDDEALATFAALEKQFPQSAWNKQSASTKSQSYYRLFRFEESLKEAENAISGSGSKDDRLDALMVAGKSYKVMGKIEAASKAFDQLSIEAASAELKAEALFESGLMKRRLRQWKDGEKALQEAAEGFQNPERKEEAFYELAMLFFEKGTFIRASKEFESILASYPNGRFTSHASFYLGRCYIYHKKYDKAVEQFLSHQSTYPEYSRGDLLLFYLAEAYRLQGDVDRSRSTLVQLVNRYPKSSLKNAAEQLLKG